MGGRTLYYYLKLCNEMLKSQGSPALNNNYTFHALFYIPLPVVLRLSRWGRSGGWMQVILFSLVVVVLRMGSGKVPYRAFNINDLFANGVGVLIGLVISKAKKLTPVA